MFIKITKLAPDNKNFSLSYELDDTFVDSQKSQLSAFCKAVTEHEKLSDITMEITDKL